MGACQPIPTAAERAAGLLTVRGGGCGPAPAHVAAAVPAQAHTASTERVASLVDASLATERHREEGEVRVALGA